MPNSRTAEVRALPLIPLIYDAALQPDYWTVFLKTLAAELGEPAIVLNIELPNTPASAKTYRVHSEDAYGRVFVELAMSGELPWSLAEIAKHERFVFSNEILSDEALGKTEFYRRYMQPQGLLCPGQLGHVMATFEGRALAAIGIYRREGGRPITAADAAMLDLLVPHLRKAYRIYCELRDTRHRRDVIAEAIDRFPVGVLFIDRDLRVVDSNRAAARIVAQQDGFSIVDGVPQATVKASTAGLVRLMEQGVVGDMGPLIASSTFSITRPSRRRAYEVHCATLVSTAPTAHPRNAVGALFIADPETQRLRMPDVLSTLYGLTPAEAELAALLCSGKSLEEIATDRGVTLHTTRTQLKRVFTKTGVKRQTDLVRLLTASVAALEDLRPE